MRNLFLLSFITLFILIFSTAIFSASTATGIHPCNDMACLDISCDEDDNCFDACLYVPGFDCQTSSPGNCSTTACFPIPIEN